MKISDFIYEERKTVMLILYIGILIEIIMIGQLNAQSVINGNLLSSYPDTCCKENQTNGEINSHISNVRAYGDASEIDYYKSWNGCTYFPDCAQPFIALNVQDVNKVDAISFTLDYPLIKNNLYTLTFKYSGDKNSSITPIDVGVSSVSNSQGTIAFTAPAPSRAWTYFTKTFIAPATGKYLTFAPGGDDNNRYVGFTDVRIIQYLPVQLLYFNATIN